MGLWYEYYINPERFGVSKYPYLKILFLEFIGMSTFVLIGCNQVVLSEDKFMLMNLQLALGYAFGLCICLENGAFLNPVLTLAFTVLGKLKLKELFVALLAQFSGALFGAMLIYGIGYDNTQKPLASQYLYTEAPGVHTYLIKSGLLMIGTMSIIDERGINPPKYLRPFMIGALLFSIGLSINNSTYGFLNLAQDLAPRIYLFFNAEGTEYWKPYNQTAYGWLIEILYHIFGALGGALVYILLIEVNHENESYDDMESGMKAKCKTGLYEDSSDEEEYSRGRYTTHKPTRRGPMTKLASNR